jgi:hypothetical protein|nr:MAG TPA: hypothetical protein [Caudoviricetes sp.]
MMVATVMIIILCLLSSAVGFVLGVACAIEYLKEDTDKT